MYSKTMRLVICILLICLISAGSAIAGTKANTPNPEDIEKAVVREATLSWSAGDSAVSHNVYLGTDFDSVNNASTRLIGWAELAEVTDHWLNTDDRLAAHWKMDDDDSNTTVVDSAGSYNGTAQQNTNVLQTAGQIDGALNFNGSSDYVNIPSSVVDISGDFTVLAWINKTNKGPAADYDRVFSFVDDADNGFQLARDEISGKYCVLLERGGTNVINQLTYGSFDETWVHIGYVVSGSSGTFYKNGQPVSNDGSAAMGTGDVASYDIGRRGDSHSMTFFKGVIDDVRIYDEALTAGKVEQIYENSSSETGLGDLDGDGDVNLRDFAQMAQTRGDLTGSDEFKGNQTSTTFDPCGLEYNVNYYWRIDEINGATVWKGDVWGFTTNKWQMPEFMINLALLMNRPGWEYEDSDAVLLAAVADANVNTVSYGPTFAAHLELCRGLGLKLIAGADTSLAVSLSDDDAVWGYYVVDEPHYPYEVGGVPIGDTVAALHEADPNHPGYINITGAVPDYHTQYIDMVNPEMISFTGGYQWSNGRARFFPSLEGYRDLALANDLDMVRWETPLTMAAIFGDYDPENMQRLRHSVYSSIAYGVKGIEWWHSYWIFERIAGTPELVTSTLNQAGQDMAVINGELQQMGPTLMTLESKEVFHTEPLPVYTKSVPQDYWVEVDTNEIVMGMFADSNGDDFVIIDNRNITTEPNVTLAFLGVDEIKKFDKTNGGWASLTLNNSGGRQAVELTLAEGDGELLSVNRIPSRPSRSQPFDGQSVGVSYEDTILSWEAGYGVASHDMYFGTTGLAVFSADRLSPLYIGNQTETTYDPGALTAGQNYYWRVDTVEPNDNIIKGDVWDFTATNCVRFLGEWTEGLAHTEEAGENRCLLFTAHIEGYEVLNSVSYGGQAMTKVIDKTLGPAYVVVYRLNEAGIASATSDTFTVNWSSEPNLVGYSSAFLSNVDQASPIGASATGSDGSAVLNETTDLAHEVSAGLLSTNLGDLVIAVGTAGNEHAYGCKNGFTTAIELAIDSADGIAGYKAASGANETPTLYHVRPKRMVIAGFVVQYDPD